MRPALSGISQSAILIIAFVSESSKAQRLNARFANKTLVDLQMNRYQSIRCLEDLPNKEDTFAVVRANERNFGFRLWEEIILKLLVFQRGTQREVPWDNDTTTGSNRLVNIKGNKISFLSAANDGLQIVFNVFQSSIVNSPRASFVIQVSSDFLRRQETLHLYKYSRRFSKGEMAYHHQKLRCSWIALDFDDFQTTKITF